MCARIIIASSVVAMLTMRADAAPFAPLRPTPIAALVALSPRLVIDVRAEEGGAPRLVTLPILEWRVEPADHDAGGVAFGAEIDDAASGIHARLRAARAPDEAAATLTVEIEHRRAAWTALEALDLTLAPALAADRFAVVFDRAIVPRAVEKIAFLDRFAATTVRAGGHTLIVAAGVDGVVVRAAPGGPIVRVEMVSVDARPFRHDIRCARRWRSPNKKVASMARLSLPGDRERAVIRLAESSPAARALTLAPARFPDGRRAALVITDHADQSAPDTLAALAFGRSDVDAPVGGLLGHHVAITKSLFFHGDERPQLEDPRVAAVAVALWRAGSEIIPHSATPHPDTREVTAAALDAFSHFNSVTWIDHQPETNCESFTNQGYRAEGPYRMADLLEAHGYRYIWAADDAGPGTLNLLPPRLTERAPTLWPLGRLAPDDSNERWLFRSSWMFLETRRFLQALAPPRLDDLESARGLAILHTYLETLHRKRTRFGRRNLLLLEPGGAVATDPRFELVLADLERRQARGSLWVPTLRALGDHLRALMELEVRYLTDGSATLRSRHALHGVTFVVRRAVAVRVDGAPPRGLRVEGDSTTFWFDLAAGHEARVQLFDNDRLVPLLGD